MPIRGTAVFAALVVAGCFVDFPPLPQQDARPVDRAVVDGPEQGDHSLPVDLPPAADLQRDVPLRDQGATDQPLGQDLPLAKDQLAQDLPLAKDQLAQDLPPAPDSTSQDAGSDPCDDWSNWSCSIKSNNAVGRCPATGTQIFSLVCNTNKCACTLLGGGSNNCVPAGQTCVEVQASFAQGCCAGL